MSEGLIASAALAPSRIDGSRERAGPPATLPARRLGLGPFEAVVLGDGRTHLMDASGASCGVFVNKQLAERTRAALEA